MKQLVKLAIAALITYAAWNGGNAWLTYFRFRDAVSEASQFGASLSDDQLRAKVLQLAAEHSIDLSDGAVTVRRDSERQHTYIDGSYMQTINVLPWYSRPFTFTWHTDTLSLTSPKVAPSTSQ
jgi:hypothetical protein